MSTSESNQEPPSVSASFSDVLRQLKEHGIGVKFELPNGIDVASVEEAMKQSGGTPSAATPPTPAHIQQDHHTHHHEHVVSPLNTAELPLSVLRSVVKIYCTTSTPNGVIPWQMRQQTSVTGSGFVLSRSRRLIMTNAHVAQSSPFVEVRKHGDSNNFTGFVIFISLDCDLAVVYIPDDGFWQDGLCELTFDVPDAPSPTAPSPTGGAAEGYEHLARLHAASDPSSTAAGLKPTNAFFGVPALQESVKVAGYPVGGEQISITSGVVSRIDVSSYGASSLSSLLTVQIDAAINSGNSGGPALNSRSKRVMGVAFQVLGNAESIGYIIPVPIIAAFLAGFVASPVHQTLLAATSNDTPSTARDDARLALTRVSARNYLPAFPMLNFVYQNLGNKRLRKYYGLKEATHQSGVVVCSLGHDSPAKDLMKPDDILMSVNGYTVENDGTIEFRPRERVSFIHLVNTTPAGSKVRLVLLRDGNSEVQVDVAPRPLSVLVSPHWFSDAFREKPKFAVFGGLVFSTLTTPLLSEWGPEWFNTAPRWLVNTLQSARMTDDLKEIVVVVQVIPHPVNQSYDFMYGRIVSAINGEKIRDFDHLKETLRGRIDRFRNVTPVADGSAYGGGADDVIVVHGCTFGAAETKVVLPIGEALKADEDMSTAFGIPPQNW